MGMDGNIMFHMSRSMFIICIHIPGITFTSSCAPPYSRDYPQPLEICSPCLLPLGDRSGGIQTGPEPVTRRATAASDGAATAASNEWRRKLTSSSAGVSVLTVPVAAAAATASITN